MEEDDVEPQDYVWVRRQWNDYRGAKFEVESLSGVRWDVMSGGVCALAPQPFLHGYVMCDEIVEGDLAHSCAHGRGPHSIKVCIVKKDNAPDIYARLAAKAGPKPARHTKPKRSQATAKS